MSVVPSGYTRAIPPASTGPEYDAAALRDVQRQKLDALVAEVKQSNPFYQRKLIDIAWKPASTPIDALPFTTRQELEADQLGNLPYGTNLTYPVTHYSRYCQTSGTGGKPMRWLDTKESWDWIGRCWKTIFEAGRITVGDRLLFAFSFGPFLGFWGAFEGSVAEGYMSIPSGGMSTSARLKMIRDNQVTVVLCTPTYAMRIAEVAREEGFDLAGSSVKALFVAGEPGGSIPETKRAIETAWNARMFDHSGMTELGPMSFECIEAPLGLHVIETEFIAEVIDPDTGKAVADGEIGELVVTNLGRLGSPLIRYRTGDQVRMTRGQCRCGRCFARLDGGILGRVDDMFIVRGNNVFPAAVEAVIRRFTEITEFRVTVLEDGSLTQVKLEIEPDRTVTDDAELCRQVAHALHATLSFRADVTSVSAGTLPRFEMKARRFNRIRKV
jgi:phenylacetate-CoA ligase